MTARVATCPNCALVPGQRYYCPDCHQIVSVTNQCVYEEHDIVYAWDNVRVEWRKYKVSPGRCKASGTDFQWLDYHECSEWWPTYEGLVI